LGIVQKVAAIACIVVGVAMVAGGFAEYSAGRASRGDRLIGLVGDELTDHGLADHAFDLNSWERGSEQLRTETLPSLADRLGVTPGELTADLQARVPEVDAALSTLPAALPFARKILDNLGRQQENFRAARTLPISGLSLEAGSWLLVLAGIVTATLGALALAMDRSWPRAALVIVGLMLVLGPIVTNFTTKADRASDLLETLNFDRKVAVETREFFEVTRDLFASVETRVLPYVAERGGVGVGDLVASTHDQFPQLALALEKQDEIAARFEARVRIRERAVGDLNEVKKVPLRELGWLVMAGGTVVLVAGIGLVALRRREREPEAHATVDEA
jgi:hypothetical protein